MEEESSDELEIALSASEGTETETDDDLIIDLDDSGEEIEEDEAAEGEARSQAPLGGGLEDAKRNLMIAEPDTIVARSNEVRSIERFITSALQLVKPVSTSGWGNLDILGGAKAGTGGRCLYISGMPGTGKTSTLLHILARMLRERDDEEDVRMLARRPD